MSTIFNYKLLKESLEKNCNKEISGIKEKLNKRAKILKQLNEGYCL
jgi:hypothetical protein